MMRRQMFASAEAWRAAMAQAGVRRGNLAGNRQRAGTVAVPDKLYFRIGEVATLCGLPSYVLRFWESEFPQLKPNKGGTGQRLYRQRDVRTALRIKSLLYEGGYTIPGARQVLSTEQRALEPQLTLAIVDNEGTHKADRAALRSLRDEMEQILDLLDGPVALPAKTVPAARSRTLPVATTPDLFD